MMASHITVFAATYRPGGFFHTCRCLREQTLKPDEVIFVLDNISHEDAFAGEQPPPGAKVLRVDFKHGYCGGSVFNRAVDAADPKTDYFMVIQDHAWFSPEWVAGHLWFNECFDAAYVSAGKKQHVEKAESFRDFKGPNCTCPGVLYPWLLGEIVGPITAHFTYGSSFSLRGDLMRQLAGWDERLEGGYGYEDVWMALRAMYVSAKPGLVTMDRRLMTHRLDCSHDQHVMARTPETNEKMVHEWSSKDEELKRPAVRLPR